MSRKKYFMITTVILIGSILFFYFISESSTKSLVDDILTEKNKHLEKINAATVITLDEEVNMQDLSEEEVTQLKEILKNVELKKAWLSKNDPADYILTVRGSNISFHIDISKDGYLSIFDEEKKEIYQIIDPKIQEDFFEIVGD